MTIKNVLVKPVLKLSDRQWRKLMARVFEREQRAGRQVAELGLEGPRPTMQGFKENPEELLANKPPTSYGPMEGPIQPLPGHIMGGELPAQQTTGLGSTSVLKDDLMHLMNPSGLEYPVGESRRWRFGMGQSEDIARAVAEARSGPAKTYNPLEEPITLKSGPRSSKAKLHKEKRKALAERTKLNRQALEDEDVAPQVSRGKAPLEKPYLTPLDRTGMKKFEPKVRSSLLKPGATLSPSMQKAVEKGGHQPTAAEMMTFKPPVTKKYARLMEREGDKVRYKDLPWLQASDEMLAHPGRYTEAGHTPPVDILKMRAPGMVKGVEAGGPVYERRFFRPVTADVERAERIAKRVEKEKKREARSLASIQESKEASVASTVSKASKSTMLEGMDPNRLKKEAVRIDTVWKTIGGGRSLTGRAWGEYLKAESKRGSGVRVDNTTVRDYFGMVALKWLHDPVKTTKRYPREVRSLELIIEHLEKEHGPIFQK